MTVTPEIPMPAPQWAMWGTKLPGGRYRLYASRDIREGRVSTQVNGFEPQVSIDARMINLIVIDGASFGECLNDLLTRVWAGGIEGRPEIEGKRGLPCPPGSEHGIPLEAEK